MLTFNAPSAKKDKAKDEEFEQLMKDVRDAYYNSGNQDGGHCFRFVIVRAPASSIAGFLNEMQKPVEQLQKAKQEVKGLEVLDALFTPKAAGYVGSREEQMTINRSPAVGK
jgi:hypothetical protein